MMAVVLRFICVFVVLCRALGAPSITYDQRQQGEYNLQVDLDDISILILPGSEFAKKNVLSNGFMRQTIGLHNGVSSKKKHNKKPADCSTTTTTTEKPEVPYGELTENEDEPTPSTLNQENSVAVHEVPSGKVSELASPPPANAADSRIYPSIDPYSVTPNTPNFSDKILQSTENKKYVASKPAEIIALRNVQKPAAVDFTKMVPVKTVEKAADATVIVKTSETSDDIMTKTETTQAVHFEEKPVSYTKTAVTTTNDETVKTDTKEEDTKIGDKLNEMSVINIVEKSSVVTENSKIATTEKPSQTEKKTIEIISQKTIIKPVAVGVQESLGTTNMKSNAENAEINTKKTNEPVQMIAMKTIEKPTFADALKATKIPAANTNSDGKTATAVTETSVMSSINYSKKPTEIMVKKTAESPSSAGSTDTIEKSGITTSTKIVEIQDDNKTQTNPGETAVVSKSAPKLTEMIAVKTVENPATVSTVKSVISVKTMIKPTGTPKTVATNSSITMRKVGDRKPLPSMTLEVASPIITV